MRLLCALVLLPGCHILAGFEELELREDPEVEWSRAYGDKAPQVAEDVVARDGASFVVGDFEGTMRVGSQALVSSGGTDVFAMALDGGGNPVWSRSFGNVNNDRVRTVTVTADSVVMAGVFSDTLAFDGVVLSSPGAESFFLANLARSDGTVSTAANFGAVSLFSTKLDVAVVPNAVFIAGGFAGTLDFEMPCTPHVTVSDDLFDAFLAKLDPSGTCVWSKQWGDAFPQAVESIGVGGDGSVVAAGEFAGSLVFDADNSLTSGGGIDIFVVKLDAAGNHRWSKSFGNSTGLQSSVRVAVHGLGNVAIAGYFDGTLDFGGGPLTSSAGHDLFVAKFDPTGAFLWSRQYATDREPCQLDACELDRIDLAVDAQGDLVLAGHFAGSVDFGGTSLSSNGGTDMFVAKLNAEDGSLLWSGSFGDDQSQCTPPDCLVAASTDSDDSVVLAGYFESSIDFGFGPHVSAGDRDAFVVKMRP